jgi:SAM-dependent methyltransferase
MDRAYYDKYEQLEKEHWWFKVRAKILEDTVRKTFTIPNSNLRILNVGASTGGTSEWLEKFGEVTSLEIDKECFVILREKFGDKAVNGSVLNIPFSPNSFDLVCAFDVIEHVENDMAAMKELARVVKKEGKIIISVPAYQALWSNHDVINHHFRRYVKHTFYSIVPENFKIDYSTYFNTVLFLPIYLMRLLHKNKRSEDSDFEKIQSSILNSTFEALFSIDRMLLANNLRLPFGVSLLCTLSKSI